MRLTNSIQFNYSQVNSNNYLLNHDNGTDVYAYDAHGNTIDMPHLQELIWDHKDELKEVTLNASGDKAYYVYDAGGERVRKVIEKTGGIIEERIYLGGYEVYRKTNNGTLEVERESLFIEDGTKKIAQIDDDGTTQTTRYQYDNHLGSASLELDETSDIISYEEYHPFGTTSYRAGRTLTETSLKRYKYVGKERDEETGLYYYGARYYAAWLCRFVSVDPLQHKYPHYTPYQYAGNKPVTFIDLDGLEEYRPELVNTTPSENDQFTSSQIDNTLFSKQRFEEVKNLFESNSDKVCIRVFNKAVKETLNRNNLNLKYASDILKTQKILENEGLASEQIPIEIYDKETGQDMSVVDLFEKGHGTIKSIGQKITQLSGDSEGIRAYGFAPAQGYHSMLIFHEKINETDTFYVGDQGASGRGFITGGFKKIESIIELDEQLIKVMKAGARYYKNEKEIDADITSFLFQLKDNSINKMKKIDIDSLDIKNEKIQQIELR